MFAADVERFQPRDCEEGELQWVAKNKILDLPMWAGDRYFLPYVLERKPFIGTIWYEGQAVVRQWVQGILVKSVGF